MSLKWKETIGNTSMPEVLPGTPRGFCEGCGREPEWECGFMAVTAGGAKIHGGGLPGKDNPGKEPQFFSSVYLFTQSLEMALAGMVEKSSQKEVCDAWVFPTYTGPHFIHTPTSSHGCSKGWHHHSHHGFFAYSYCWWTLVKEQKAKRPVESYGYAKDPYDWVDLI